MNPADTILPIDDPESALVRKVYARYGLAMYMAQVLEHAIVHALLVLRFLPTRPDHRSNETWESAFDDFYVCEVGKTFDNVLRNLLALDIVPLPLMDRLREAKKTRDSLPSLQKRKLNQVARNAELR